MKFLNNLLSAMNTTSRGRLASLSLAFATLLAVASTAYAQNGLGGYDLKSSADLSFAFDYKGAGRLDHVVLYRPGAGIIFIEEKQGAAYVPVFTSFGGIGGYDLKSPADRIIAFDYSGTGHADHLLCYRPGTGVVWILANTNGQFFPVYNSAGGIGGFDLKSTADKIITFDYDGSGKYDHLVAYRPGTGVVYIVKNTNGTFSDQLESTTGIGGYDLLSPNDLMIAFDYYGVGIGDHLLAYRPGSGTAFVMENTNGSGTFAAVQTSFSGFGGYDLKSANDRMVAYDAAKIGSQNYLIAYRPGAGVAYLIGGANLSFSPMFTSTTGLGGYDLLSTADRIFTFDYNSTDQLDTLALYRPGASDFYIEANVNGNLVDQVRASSDNSPQ